METHGRYVLIGAFTVLGFVGMAIFLLWFGASQANRQFTEYDVLFDTVSGITRSSEVRYAGLPVGQVTALAIDPEGSGKVRVSLEVSSNTPVRVDSVATLEAQGVTGTSVVAISPGKPSAELLSDTSDDVPVITAGRSPLQNISESAPAVLDQALKAIEQVNDLLSPTNRTNVSKIIENVEGASEKLASTLEAADSAMSNIGDAVDSLSKLTSVADSLSGKAGSVLDGADSAIRGFGSLKGETENVLKSTTRVLDTAERVLNTNIQPILSDLSNTAEKLSATAERIAPKAETLLETWSATGKTATARLDEAKALITSLTQTAEAIDAETARKLNRALDQVADDLPQLTADLRDAGERASEAFTSLNTLITGANAPVNDFLRRGLPQFVQLAGDARGLMTSLNSLVTSLRRNPAGTLLRNDMPEFRR